MGANQFHTRRAVLWGGSGPDCRHTPPPPCFRRAGGQKPNISVAKHSLRVIKFRCNRGAIGCNCAPVRPVMHVASVVHPTSLTQVRTAWISREEPQRANGHSHGRSVVPFGRSGPAGCVGLFFDLRDFVRKAAPLPHESQIALPLLRRGRSGGEFGCLLSHLATLRQTFRIVGAEEIRRTKPNDHDNTSPESD
jgi:hypothetical protein